MTDVTLRASMDVSNPSVVLPGDIVDARRQGKHPLKLGPGLLQLSSISESTGEDPIVATRPGLLKNSDGKNWWIEVNQRRVTKQCHRVVSIM